MSNCTYKVKIKDIQNNYKVIMEDIQNKYKFKIFCTGNSYDDTEIREEIEALQDELDEAEEELEQYKTIYNALPKVTGEGSNITLNNTANSVMKFKEYKGDTYQETTTGKNKYGIINPQPGVYGNGLPRGSTANLIIDNYDLNNITFHSTSTGGNYLQALFSTFQLEPNTSYTITYTRTNILSDSASARRFIYSLDASDNYSIIHYLTGNDEGNMTYTFSTTATGKVAIAFGFFTNNATNTSTINNLMVRLETESNTYEPYTYGASPNPSYPQNIEVVTGTQNVEVCGKNLFNKDNTNIIDNYYLNDNGELASNNNFYVYEYTPIAPNTTYSIQPYKGYTACYCFYDKNKTFISSIRINLINPNFTTPSNCQYIRYSVRKSDADELQLEKGSTVTTYQAYQGTTYPVNLGNIELCKIGTYQDRIYKRNNKWYLEKKVGKVVLNGSEDWTIQPNISGLGITRFRTTNKLINVLNISSREEIISNYFYYLSGGSHGIGGGFIASEYLYLYYGYDGVTVQDFTTWLSVHNTTVYYALATPTTTEITDTTLIGQLETIDKQLAYKGQTNIIVSGNLPVIINVETLKDLSVEETTVASVTRLQSIRPTIIQPEINNIEEQPEEIEEEIPEQE